MLSDISRDISGVQPLRWARCPPRRGCGRRRKLAAAGAGSAAAGTGALPAGQFCGRGRRLQRRGEDGRTSCRAVLYVCCKEANWNKGPETKLWLSQKGQNCMIMSLCRQQFCREALEATFRAEARFQPKQVGNYLFLHNFYIIIASLLRHYYVLEITSLHHYYIIITY